jgi:hypothetical protein
MDDRGLPDARLRPDRLRRVDRRRLAGGLERVAHECGVAGRVRVGRDGKCAIAVSRPVSFSVEPRLGVTKVSIAAIDPDMVTVRAKGPGISLQVVVRVGSAGRLNGIGVRVVAITGGTAVLRFSPT